MIKHLSGDYETVEYDGKRSFLLHDNYDNEAYPVHWHNDAEIILPLENKYSVIIGGMEYVIPCGDVLIIPPAELHSMPAIPGHRLILQYDHSVLESVPAVKQIMRCLTAPILIDKDLDKDLHSISKKIMLDIYSLNRKNSEIADIKIFISLVTLLTAVREFQLSRSKTLLECDDLQLDEYNEKFSAVIKYIDDNYMYDITLEKLAEVAGYSKYHFSRIFKQFNSMSYLRYINARRTKAAEHLLLDPDLSVTEVAMMSGFKSLTTFNRIFKEIKHCTPTDFKKLYSEH